MSHIRSRTSNTFLIVVALLFLIAEDAFLFAQTDSATTQQEYPSGAASDAPFLRQIVVHRSDAKRVAGILLDTLNDTIRLQSRGEEHRIPFRDVAMVNAFNPPRPGRVGMYGMVIGMYLGNLLFWTDSRGVAYYLDAEPTEMNGYWLSNLFFAGLVGGLAYLLAPATLEVETFTFVRGTEENESDVRRFLEFAGGGSEKSVHVSLQMSAVHPVESNHAAVPMQQAGYGAANSRSPSPGEFNLLRKLQITYDVHPSTAVGLAYMALTENPNIPYSYSSEASFLQYVRMKSTLTGFYAAGTFDPLMERLPPPYEWKIGAGLGFVSYGNEIESHARTGNSPNVTTVDNNTVTSGNLISAMVFTDFNIYLYDGLSLGLSAEYVLISKLSLDPIPGITTTETTINFSSTSWGFVLGFHF